MGRKRKEIEPKLGRRAAVVAGPDADELARIALDLFAERHYSTVTIKDIGKAANVNSAMIYYHYRDKLALFNAAIDSATSEAFQHFDDNIHNGKHENAASAINAWFDVHVTLYKRLRNVIKISMDCSGPEFSDARSTIKNFYSHEKKILGDIINDGIDSGIFRKVDVSVVCTMISAFLDGILARSLMLKDFDMLKTVEEFKRTLWLHLGYRTVPVRTSSRSNTTDRKSA
ncbi:TetR/AcrR family transcriptional regulator [Hyphomicrobium facile]|uniref:DNA-binding transcriptional regulator, AcrR family n=1 Tax=Hyphomicrobium facile TaxID=51670 RepID=A0A1I7MWK2_9HYPH|nr:TetR/AcrR family transcriptional regulator [Hyphomicrobium facile]SFV26755.1 DNA-binding transcriptional regulator, AcrR family [Hyphomicrobium facile]